MNDSYFLAVRDQEVIEAGGFFCLACLMGKPLDDRSPDPRYCLGCYDFLMAEAGLLPREKHPAWVPKATGAKIAQKNLYQGVERGVGIMSTVKDEKSEVDIISPPVATRPITKRGPKHKNLPEELIVQLSSKGMGSKAIVTELRNRGINVSYKTIQRLLTGQRVLV